MPDPPQKIVIFYSRETSIPETGIHGCRIPVQPDFLSAVIRSDPAVPSFDSQVNLVGKIDINAQPCMRPKIDFPEPDRTCSTLYFKPGKICADTRFGIRFNGAEREKQFGRQQYRKRFERCPAGAEAGEAPVLEVSDAQFGTEHRTVAMAERYLTVEAFFLVEVRPAELLEMDPVARIIIPAFELMFEEMESNVDGSFLDRHT